MKICLKSCSGDLKKYEDSMSTLDVCWGTPYSVELEIKSPRDPAVQSMLHVGDSSQATERDPNRHPGRPDILERTTGPSPPADFWPDFLLGQDLPKLPQFQAAVWIPPVYAPRMRLFAPQSL
jgi:hypothetical protein